MNELVLPQAPMPGGDWLVREGDRVRSRAGFTP